MTLNGKNKILAESYFGKKKIPENSIAEKKKKNHTQKKLPSPPSHRHKN